MGASKAPLEKVLLRAGPTLCWLPLLGEQLLHFVWAAQESCGMGEEEPAQMA